MKLTEIKNEQALDAIADCLEPIEKIAQDKEVVELLKAGERMNAISVGLKRHKPEIIKILAALNGKTVEEFEFNVLTLPVMLLEILNDKELQQLF